MLDSAPRHAADDGFVWILDDRNTAMVLDHVEAIRAIVESAGKDHADDPIVESPPRGTEERINRWPESVFPGPVEHPKRGGGNDQVKVRPGDEDMTPLEHIAVPGEGNWEITDAPQYRWQYAAPIRTRVHHDEHARLKVSWQPLDDGSQRLQSSR